MSHECDRNFTLDSTGCSKSCFFLQGETSELHDLIGGGLLEYLVQSNNNVNYVDSEDRFKYIDDLSILEVLNFTGLLVEYDFTLHMASDIGSDQLFLPPNNFHTQENLNQIAN